MSKSARAGDVRAGICPKGVRPQERAYRMCRCDGCLKTSLCTPDNDFYDCPPEGGGDLLCASCLEERVGGPIVVLGKGDSLS